jgi:hypothetical protein
VAKKQGLTNSANVPAATRQTMSEARDIELLFAIWEQNVETVRAKPESRSKEQLEATSDQKAQDGAGAKIDKSVLTISEPRQIRSKEHLRLVAQQPCLICGEIAEPRPSHSLRTIQIGSFA